MPVFTIWAARPWTRLAASGTRTPSGIGSGFGSKCVPTQTLAAVLRSPPKLYEDNEMRAGIGCDEIHDGLYLDLTVDAATPKVGGLHRNLPGKQALKVCRRTEPRRAFAELRSRCRCRTSRLSVLVTRVAASSSPHANANIDTDTDHERETKHFPNHSSSKALLATRRPVFRPRRSHGLRFLGVTHVS